MRKIIFMMLCLACAQAHAQKEIGTLTVTPQLGVNVSNVTGYRELYRLSTGSVASEKSKAAAGIVAGVEGAYQLTDLLYVSAGLNLTQQKMKVNSYSDFLGEDVVTSVEHYTGISGNKLKTTYLHLPVMAGCYVYEGLSVKLGVEFGYLLSARRQWSQGAIDLDRATGLHTYTEPVHYSSSYKNEMRKVDIAIPVGVDYEYENVVLDLRYHLGLTKAIKSTGSKNRGLSLTVGYRFDLGKDLF